MAFHGDCPISLITPLVNISRYTSLTTAVALHDVMPGVMPAAPSKDCGRRASTISSKLKKSYSQILSRSCTRLVENQKHAPYPWPWCATPDHACMAVWMPAEFLRTTPLFASSISALFTVRNVCRITGCARATTRFNVDVGASAAHRIGSIACRQLGLTRSKRHRVKQMCEELVMVHRSHSTQR